MSLGLNIKKRQGYRLNVQKMADKILEFWDRKCDGLPELYELTTIEKKIENYENNLEPLNSKIETGLDEADLENEFEKTNEINDLIWDTQVKIKLMQGEIAAKSGGPVDNMDNGSTHSGARATVKLPQLNIPKYSGDPLQWQEFWDSFSSTIHENSDLSEIDKFKYLKGYLMGDALRVVDGFRVISANYDTVVDTLKERFGNQEIAVFAHFERLLSLPMSSTDTSSLQKSYDESEKHIRSLVSLGLEENKFGQVFTPILLSKLPRAVRVELYRQNGSKPWCLSTLRELLRDEIKARSMSDWALGDHQHQAGGGSGAPGKGDSSRFQSNKGSKPNVTSAGALAHASTSVKWKPNRPCAYCQGEHFADQCKKFATVQARITCLKNRCSRCLALGHSKDICNKTVPCCYCGKDNHHRSLCFKQFGPINSSSASVNTSQGAKARGSSQPINTAASDFVTSQNGKSNSTGSPAQSTTCVNGSVVYMQMAVVRVRGLDQPVRIFFDIGSSCSYITTSLAKKLRLKSVGETTLCNSRFEERRGRIKTYQRVNVPIPVNNGSPVVVSALITDVICSPVQKRSLDLKECPILGQIALSDPPVSQVEMVSIDILIGNDYYYDLVGAEQIRLNNGLVLIGSKLGYIPSGRVGVSDGSDHTGAGLLINSSYTPLTCSHDIEQFWRLEDIGVKDDSFVKDDELALKSFNSSIQFVNGRYQVGWPWKDGSPELPNNYNLALSRLRHLTKRLHQDEKLLQSYHAVIQGQLETGVIEVAPLSTGSSRTHYIPHHCVVKPGITTTKVRIVYDASSKAQKAMNSLNDCLLRGPVFLQDLCGMLVRLRSYPVAMTSDIEKAFLQVGMRISDRDVTRFLWLHDIHKAPSPDNLVTYRFCRVPFGTISSPFLLNGTVKHHLLQAGTDIANHIANNIYVDNCIGGASNADEAKNYYVESKQLFSQISMNIREWYSNCNELMESIPSNDRGNGTVTKVLGIRWDTKSDVIGCFDPKVEDFVVRTKRQLLQAVSRLFDPCGFMAPVVLRAKILVQDCWKQKIPWDSPLPTAIASQWDNYAQDFGYASKLDIPRYISCEGGTTWQMHCFCDASGKAYTAVVYFKPDLPGTKGSLIMCKTRLAPLHPITLPRLELMAVVVGVRLMKFLEGQVSIKFSRRFLWSDSKCVLQWIISKKVLTVFVSNRVREIKSHADIEFRYVPTDLNPADISSRGMSAKDLQTASAWWQGPTFLQAVENVWPITSLGGTSTEETAHAVQALTVSTEFPIEIQRYSSLSRLVRVTGWVLRYVNNLKSIIQRNTANVTKTAILATNEVEMARVILIKAVQREAYGDFQEKKMSGLQKHLGVFLDDKGLWRCSGRLQLSMLSGEEKFPILLPKSFRFTQLVILDCHFRVHHFGTLHTLSEVRSQYWVPCGKSQIQSVIHRCPVCRRFQGGAFKTPDFPPLPACRVTRSVPFSTSGVDYLGPVYIQNPGGKDPKKVWICLFTCAVTRAIHLEVVEDMTTDQFLLCLRRFVSIYGRPTTLISDNGKYFKLAYDVLKRLWLDILNSPDIKNYSSQKNITWKYIPEYSPWMGGFYERLVGSVKQSLKKVLHRKLVSLVQMQTVVSEISSVINSRPLVMSHDVNDSILTPAHLLGKGIEFPQAEENSNKKAMCGLPQVEVNPGQIGLPQVEVNPGQFGLPQVEANSAVDDNARFPQVEVNHGLIGFPQVEDHPDQFQNKVKFADEVVQMWKNIAKIVNQFWDIWLKQYLASLREVTTKIKNRNVSNIKPEIGTVVLIKDNLPRSLWKMGVITCLQKSSDGLCRSVQLRLSNGKTVNRPVKLLFPIEGTIETSQSQSSAKNDADDELTQTFQRRPVRKAAVSAREKVAQQLQTSDSE